MRKMPVRTTLTAGNRRRVKHTSPAINAEAGSRPPITQILRTRNHARALACAKGGEGMYGPGRLHAALAVPLGDAEHLCTAIALG
jgi:hypothetical protein